jgi:hypothetical protein
MAVAHIEHPLADGFQELTSLFARRLAGEREEILQASDRCFSHIL